GSHGPEPPFPRRILPPEARRGAAPEGGTSRELGGMARRPGPFRAARLLLPGRAAGPGSGGGRQDPDPAAHLPALLRGGRGRVPGSPVPAPSGHASADRGGGSRSGAPGPRRPPGGATGPCEAAAAPAHAPASPA